jgi:excisionase family DNA binding protein
VSALRFGYEEVTYYGKNAFNKVGRSMSKVMTIEEVGVFLRVHPSTVYRLLKRHKIPAFKMRSDWRFNQESIERWVKEREAENGIVLCESGGHV